MWPPLTRPTWHHSFYRQHIRSTNIMNAYIHFNHEHNVLICKVHQYAVSSKFLARHFLEEHDLDIKIRQEITNYASQFTTVEPSQVLYSLEKIIPVPYLNIITGFQCQYERCGKVLGTLASIKHHCKVDHDWKAKDGSQWMETRAQTFFQSNIKRYVNYIEGKLIL
jgi:hypothetical protein